MSEPGAVEADHVLRRDTPLALLLKQRIAREGSLSVADYMRACLYDPAHGYYVKQTAIGADGDFITAPEISQVFGELIGLWCVVVWQQMGRPARFNLIELGPGRGTLIADALRAARVAPDFVAGASIVLVETNEKLRARQAESLAAIGVKARWTSSLAHPEERDPAAAAIVIGNEFLDTRPVRQFMNLDGSWFERVVTLDVHGALAFSLREAPTSGGSQPDAPAPSLADGNIVEVAESTDEILEPLQEIARDHPVAALLIDYGHTESRLGDTLQAVRAHAYEHPLTSPGEADLTAQVDFQAVRRAAISAGFAVDGPVTQGEFLASLGIAQRASRLMAANPARANEIESAIARIMSPTGMGTRFKATGIRSPALPALPGLQGGGGALSSASPRHGG